MTQKLTIGQMFDLIDQRLGQLPSGLGRNSVRRRLAQLVSQADRKYLEVVVDLPKPVLSDEGKETLGNSQPASTRRTRSR